MLHKLWRFLRGPATCRACGLLRVQARDVECRCAWAQGGSDAG